MKSAFLKCTNRATWSLPGYFLRAGSTVHELLSRLGPRAIRGGTVPTLVLFPAIVVLYFRLARVEERRLIERFGESYFAYGNGVPRFLPRRAEWSRVWGALRTGPRVTVAAPADGVAASRDLGPARMHLTR